MEPWGKESRAIVGMSLIVQSEQRFLQKILRLRRPMAQAREAISVVGSQMSREPLEKRVICASIAVETGDHQGAQLGFLPVFGGHYGSLGDFPSNPVGRRYCVCRRVRSCAATQSWN